MLTSFFCVDLIRTLFAETIATSAIRGTSVKKSFLEAVEYISHLTGMDDKEIGEFFPAEYVLTCNVIAFGKYHKFTVTKSRFELYPIVS